MHGGALDGQDAGPGVDLADRDGLGRAGRAGGPDQGGHEERAPRHRASYRPKSTPGSHSATWGKKKTSASPMTWRIMKSNIPR